MKRERTIRTFDIEIPREFAFRLLGVNASGRRPRRSVLEIFDEQYAIAHDLVQAKVVMRMSSAGLPGSAQIDSAMPIVAAVCTIGPALERRVADLTDRDEVTRAVVLDAIGSSAAEEVADRSNRVICSLAEPASSSPARRRSPGYGKWDIREQAAIFRFLDPEEIGVTLTDAFMMVPRKSVSYVVPLEGGEPGEELGSRCEHCEMEHCPHRSEEKRGENR